VVLGAVALDHVVAAAIVVAKAAATLVEIAAEVAEITAAAAAVAANPPPASIRTATAKSIAMMRITIRIVIAVFTTKHISGVNAPRAIGIAMIHPT